MGAARAAKTSGWGARCEILAAMRRPGLILSAIAIVLATACSSAAARVITVGSPLHGEFEGQECLNPTGTWANDTLAEPGAYASSPVDGVVVRWRMFGNFTSEKPFALRILRPAAGGGYTGVGTSAQETPVKGLFGTYSWRTELPVKKGDIVGINVYSDCVGVSGVTGSHTVYWFPALGEGSSLVPTNTVKDVEIGVQALVQPVPTAASISPANSGLAGGEVVTITGTDLEEASSVTFGGVPATDFSVEGGSRITAVVPPAAGPGQVPVSVTTIAGTATVPQPFAYEACVVPKLKGKAPAAAKKALSAAGCGLGKVTHRAGPKTGKKMPRVVGQSPAPGKTLPAGTKIALTVKG